MPAWRGVPALLGVAAVLVAVTVYPDWGRAPAGRLAVSVRLPDLAPGSLVVLLDPSPMAYAAAFAPRSVRFVGADNNLVQPGGGTALDRCGGGGDRGPEPARYGGWRKTATAADATLRAYGLTRAPGCVRVRSNLDGNAILACKLRRLTRTPAPPVP